jgi:uncharacterized protein
MTNVEAVRKVYESFKRRDMVAVFTYLDPEIEIVQSTQLPWGGHYRGYDEAKQYFGKLFQAVETVVTLEQFLDAGDAVVALGRTQGRAVATGKRIDVPVAHRWTLRNGRAVRLEIYLDNPTMLQALAP